jgi:CHAD domain-containing protein
MNQESVFLHRSSFIVHRFLVESRMAEGKWISDLMADTPLAEAARRVVALRLEVVRDYLHLALRQADKDPEYVHQLRVGTRRAGAALEIFALCLSPKVYKRARKQLRRLRRAAGEARDWDVFLEELRGRQQAEPSREQTGLDFLLGYALAQRNVAQAHLEAAKPKPPMDFQRFLTETVVAVHEPLAPQDRCLLDLARPMLSGLLKEMDQAVAADLNEYSNLHQVRIVGKRLRYAMEVFADCFAPAFRDKLYPAVEEMQEILGRANDSHVASTRLTLLRSQLRKVFPEEWKRLKAGIEGLLRYHRRRLPVERRRFFKWWRRWRESGGEAAFAALLKAQEPVTVAGADEEGEV